MQRTNEPYINLEGAMLTLLAMAEIAKRSNKPVLGIEWAQMGNCTYSHKEWTAMIIAMSPTTEAAALWRFDREHNRNEFHGNHFSWKYVNKTVQEYNKDHSVVE